MIPLIKKRYAFFVLIFTATSILSFAQNVIKNDYLQLKGSISSYPIKMKLQISDNVYKGIYFYEKTQEPISISGTTINNGNSINLIADINQKEERFTLIKNGNDYTGTWTGSGNRPSLPVKLSIEQGSMHFDIYKLEDSLKLLPDSENSPMASFSITALWPSEMNTLGTFVSRQIIKSISGKAVSNDIEEVLINNRNEYFNAYKENFKDELPATIQESSFGFNSSMDQAFSVKYESTEFIVIESQNYNYDGGAHGLFGSGFINIDKKKLKLISVKDVILNPNSKMLLRILEKRFRLESGATVNTKLTELGLSEDELTTLADEFYINDKGITFYYSTYQIATYVRGPVEIFVPFKDLKGMLTSGFQKYAQ
jgi:hypothetical protein